MFGSVSGSGLDIFVTYGKLVLLLVGSMLAVVLVVDPIILFIHLRCNPYPLIWRCVRESGVTAFFTRSSAANIPVNMELCERLGLDKDVYSVSIPLRGGGVRPEEEGGAAPAGVSAKKAGA